MAKAGFLSRPTSSPPPASPPVPAHPVSKSNSHQISKDAIEQRHRRFEDLIALPVIDLDRIRAISWAGIPDDFRAMVWRLFLDYEPVNSAIRAATLQHKRNDYFDCVERVFSESQRHLWTNSQRQTEAQIMRDLPRTHIVLLRNERVQLLFERVLFVWSVRHPASGYVQGMNDLLYPFFFVFLIPHSAIKDVNALMRLQDLADFDESDLKEIEADCFWCFSKLLDGLQDLYTRDQPGLYHMLQSLSVVIERTTPELAAWIRQEEIQYQEFAFRWMNCLLVREFPAPLLFRLWDSYISNNSTIASTHVYVCAALMSSLSAKLVGLSHAEFVIKLQSIDPEGWSVEDLDMILAQAFCYENMFARSPSHLKSGNS
jgi:hypothetical protein